jgi:4-hydroxythreonine-4-phosphate dehydrogenase
MIKVGISHGDINGVGYEVIIKTFLDNRILEMCTPIVYGSSKVASFHRKALNLENFSFNIIAKSQDANPKRANLINCTNDDINIEIGKSTTEAGLASIKALNLAVDDAIQGKIDVLITAPINKENVQSKEFNFNGHTEFLQSKTNSDDVLMLLCSEVMRVGIVTSHLPLSKVPQVISEEVILKKLQILNKSLIEDFGVRKPRIAVLGLNPHSGDGGLLGTEENDIIIPAIKKAKENNIMAFGPYAADGFFGNGNFKKFDAILAMYHDQGLAPFKALSFEDGVNYTAGLPIVRTSPAHGTAYDIAGKNMASPDSFRQAIYLACDIFNNRKMYKELNENPLKVEVIQQKEKR